MKTPKLNKYARAVLVGAYQDRERLAGLDWNPGGKSLRERGAYRVQIAEARRGLVKLNARAWLGRPVNPSDSVGLTRAYARLESAGLIERIRLGLDADRTTHLSLTDAGAALARKERRRKPATA